MFGFIAFLLCWQTCAMAETYKGLIVAEDGSELPETIRFKRRVSGEQSKETIATNGGFQFETEKKDAKSARYEIRLPGFAPHDTHWMDLNRPIRIKLSRGAKVELKIQSDLPMPADAKVSVKGPWYFDNKHCGDFQIGKSGQSIVVPFCPKGTVKFDLHIPGFEEARKSAFCKTSGCRDAPLSVRELVETRLGRIKFQW